MVPVPTTEPRPPWCHCPSTKGKDPCKSVALLDRPKRLPGLHPVLFFSPLLVLYSNPGVVPSRWRPLPPRSPLAGPPPTLRHPRTTQTLRSPRPSVHVYHASVDLSPRSLGPRLGPTSTRNLNPVSTLNVRTTLTPVAVPPVTSPLGTSVPGSTDRPRPISFGNFLHHSLTVPLTTPSTRPPTLDGPKHPSFPSTKGRSPVNSPRTLLPSPQVVGSVPPHGPCPVGPRPYSALPSVHSSYAHVQSLSEFPVVRLFRPPGSRVPELQDPAALSRLSKSTPSRWVLVPGDEATRNRPWGARVTRPSD